MITRYRLEYDDLDIYDNGNLVKYEDHQREVAQLQARVAELEELAAKLAADVAIARGASQQLKEFALRNPSRQTPAVVEVCDSILEATK